MRRCTFYLRINGILIVDATVVSTGKTVSKVVSQNINEEDLDKKIRELEKLKVHPKDITENRILMGKLYSLYEESPIYLRENILEFIRKFERLLEEQDPRKIKKYLRFLQMVISEYETYDPFNEEYAFDKFDENWDEDFDEEEEEFNFYNTLGGETKWTS